MRRFEISPALNQLAVSDAPDNDPAEFNFLAVRAIRRAPGVAHNHLVAFGDDVFDGDANVWKALEGGG